MNTTQLNSFIKRPLVRVFLHLIFWATYLFISAITVKKFYEDDSVFVLMYRYAITAPVDILATYFTAYFLLPKFLYHRKYLVFCLLFLISVIGFILMQRFILFKISYPFVIHIKPSYPFFTINWFYSFTNIYLVVFIVSGIKLLQRNFKEEKSLQELGEKKIEAELKFLKAQIHPHFLFNTLNNLYALTLDNSKKAPEVVLKLSELLNYMLYECNEQTILLTKEIKLIENYLSLEQIRYADNLDLKFIVDGEITGKKVAPMLLLPFVENAFKHGVSKVSRESLVEIHLSVDAEILSFSVTNSKPSTIQEDPAGYADGIGLKNVQRRLELMYPEQHEIEYQPSDSIFKISLKLKIN